MGNTCGTTTTNNQSEHQRFPTPHAIDDIGGFRVDREHAQYQYALLCVTRLAEKYMSNLFPDVHASLVEFGEQQIDYLTVTNELYNALSFPERPLKNCEVDATADSLAKEAITELTLIYMALCEEHEAKEKPEAGESPEAEKKPEVDDGPEAGDKPDAEEGPDAEERLHAAEERTRQEYTHPPALQKNVQDLAEFEMFYEDTLKMIITDIENKNVWKNTTFFCNQSFRDLLERKEPELALALSAVFCAEVEDNTRTQHMT